VERKEMQSFKFYTVNLTKIEGKGQFKCPRCGAKISPEDKTERTYTICESVIKDNSLESIVLQCNKCGSQIHLTGFTILNRMRC
jgi:ribosomal protein S27AE